MGVSELPAWLEADHGALTDGILRRGRYRPTLVRRAEIPKKERGKVGLLSIPTCVDHMIQQAVPQQLAPIFNRGSDEHVDDTPLPLQRVRAACGSDGLRALQHRRQVGARVRRCADEPGARSEDVGVGAPLCLGQARGHGHADAGRLAINPRHGARVHQRALPDARGNALVRGMLKP